MEAGGASETDAKLKTFDEMTLRVAATAGVQVAYGHGAGESLKSLGPYPFCAPDVQAAAAAMGVVYGTVHPPKPFRLACLPLVFDHKINPLLSYAVPRWHVPQRSRFLAFFTADNAC